MMRAGQAWLCLLFIAPVFVSCSKPTRDDDEKDMDFLGKSVGNVRGSVRALAISADSTRVIWLHHTGRSYVDDTITFFSFSDNTCDDVMTPPAGTEAGFQHTALAFGSSGKWAAVDLNGDGLYLINLETKKLTQLGNLLVLQSIFSADGSTLFAIHKGLQLEAWNVSEGKNLWTVDCPTELPWAMGYDSAHGELAIVGEEKIILVDANNGRTLKTIQAPEGLNRKQGEHLVTVSVFTKRKSNSYWHQSWQNTRLGLQASKVNPKI